MQTPDDAARERQREATLFRYIEAFDRGDLDALADVLDEALHDPELDQQLAGVDAALYAEAGLATPAEQATLVRRLLLQHLPSGIPGPVEAPNPPTVGEVAAKLAADPALRPPLTAEDRLTLRRFHGDATTLPRRLTTRAVQDLFRALGVTDRNQRLEEAFRRAAVALGMSRAQESVQLAAARRQGRVPRAARPSRLADDGRSEESESEESESEEERQP
jgi:hypothetical protein